MLHRRLSEVKQLHFKPYIFLAVDYDSTEQSYAFDVTVSDGLHSTIVGVTVSITAVNEYTPSLTTVTETVAENMAVGSSITTFTATDIDYSPHDITSYTITAGSKQYSTYCSKQYYIIKG